MNAIEAVTVVVPARNEQALVVDCLESLLTSLKESDSLPHIVVVADSCEDDTAGRSKGVLGRYGTVIEGAWRNAGAARYAGTQVALCRERGRRANRHWLASTDADTTVPADWVQRQLAYAASGFAAVAGIVEVSSFDGHPRGTARSFDELYTLPETGDHTHVHGANLGVVANAYLSVGGWPRVALAEDHGLWQRLKKAGWPTVSPRDVRVYTSGRPVGRAPGGFADTLRRIGNAHAS